MSRQHRPFRRAARRLGLEQALSHAIGEHTQTYDEAMAEFSRLRPSAGYEVPSSRRKRGRGRRSFRR